MVKVRTQDGRIATRGDMLLHNTWDRAFPCWACGKDIKTGEEFYPVIPKVRYLKLFAKLPSDMAAVCKNCGEK